MFYQEKVTSYETHTRIISGINSTVQLTEEIEKIGAKKVMVISGRHVSKTNFYTQCLEYVKQSGVEYVTYNEVSSEAPASDVERAVAFLREQGGVELLIAIGGGSVIDLSKCVGVMATNGGKPRDWIGYEKFSVAPIPLFSVPTTAGTASEVTCMAIIHDEEVNDKFTVAHRELNCSKVAFLDSKALLECPVGVIADSGIDALSHNLESFYSLKANPMTEAISIKGIEVICKNLPVVYATAAKNQMAALDLFMGSTMGGMAFTTTGTGHMHGIGRYVGPYFHISHGLSIAFLMAEVVRFNAMAQPEKTLQVARAMGIDCTGLRQNEITDEVVAFINQLTLSTGLDQKLKNLSATQEDLERIAEDCVKDYQTRYYLINPRYSRKEDYINILNRAYSYFCT